MSIMMFLLPPNGKYVWDAPPGCEFVSTTGQMISAVRAVNEGQEAGQVELARDGKAIIIRGSDGIRWAYKDREAVVGDLEVWDMFERLMGHTQS